MKKYLIIALAAVSAATAFGKPARKMTHRYRQPDGSYITVIKSGDESGHRVTTADGKLLRFDKEKGYVLAENAAPVARRVKRPNVEPAIPEAVREAMPATRGVGLCSSRFPGKGEQKALVILAEFKDVKFNSKNKAPYNSVDSKVYFSDMLNKVGFNTYGGTGSARDFFVQNSKGQFTPQFDVYGPVTLSQNVAYYGTNDKTTYEDVKATEVVIEACKLLDDQINFKDYDRDGDGYVDNVYVFYAGHGEADIWEEDEAEMNVIWPHAWYISAYNGSALTLDGVKIDSYGMSNETVGIDDPDSDLYAGRPDGVGTFIHEFSHVLGLPDLYCTTDYENYKDIPFTPGEWSCLDYGPYNNSGKTPPNYSMYERYALDWITPKEFTVGSTAELPVLADSNEGYIVKTDKATEFFLFENRQLNGWDAFLPNHGMLVWHVDFVETVFENNEVNNKKTHQYVDLVEADNIQDYPTGYNWLTGLTYGASTLKGDPFPGSKNIKKYGYATTPSLRSWSGKNLGINLTNITESAGKITMSVDDGKGSSVADVFASLESGVVYNLQGVKVAEFANGALPELPAGIYVVRTAAGRALKVSL